MAATITAATAAAAAAATAAAAASGAPSPAPSSASSSSSSSWLSSVFSETHSDACGSFYHNLSACDFPMSPASNCTATYMALQQELYLALCGGLFVVSVLSCAHLVYRIEYLLRVELPMSRLRFPLSLYMLSVLFCLAMTFRSIDVFGYAGASLVSAISDGWAAA
jgi:hypothetical protein